MSALQRGQRAIGAAPVDEKEKLLPEETDDLKWHFRELDPAEADIYVDALFAPLVFKYERLTKDKVVTFRFGDYLMVSLFLLVNMALQLAISFKIDQVALRTYGEVGQTLFNGACWHVAEQEHFFGLLYSEKEKFSNDFDCGEPLLTLAMHPEKLDLNKDGFWSMDEANQVAQDLRKRGSTMASNFSQSMLQFAKYDARNREGSKSGKHLDMDFFTHYRGRIQMCLPVDPNLCGNLEARGKLQNMLPDMDGAENRVLECRENFHSFCTKLFGGDYEWIHYTTSEMCGHSKFERKNGVNVVVYQGVATYQGEADSVLGTTFKSFVVLLLFIWGMLMIKEFRSIYNFIYVVWYIPSTSEEDPEFYQIGDDGKVLIKKLPTTHKAFAFLCILLPRLIIAIVILVVGASFLTATNNLQDLVLNSTALCFLIEVDNMIHASFLGEHFVKQVIDHCGVVRVPTTSQGTAWPFIFLVIALLTTGAWAAWAYFNPEGLAAIGRGMECLCHFDGDCFAASLI